MVFVFKYNKLEGLTEGHGSGELVHRSLGDIVRNQPRELKIIQ